MCWFIMILVPISPFSCIYWYIHFLVYVLSIVCSTMRLSFDIRPMTELTPCLTWSSSSLISLMMTPVSATVCTSCSQFCNKNSVRKIRYRYQLLNQMVHSSTAHQSSRERNWIPYTYQWMYMLISSQLTFKRPMGHIAHLRNQFKSMNYIWAKL